MLGVRGQQTKDILSAPAEHAKIALGQIRGVDASAGTCRVVLVDSASERGAVPMFFANISSKGWLRSIPTNGSWVLVGFRADGQAEILKSVIPGNFSAMSEAHAKGKLPYFRPLRETETDIATSGGAYGLWGDDGTLFLAGGPGFIQISKNRNEIVQTSRTIIQNLPDGDDLFFKNQKRFGIVKRFVANEEKIITSDFIPIIAGGGPLREDMIDLAYGVPPPPGYGLNIYKSRVGNVVNNTGLEQRSLWTGQKLRTDVRVYSRDGFLSTRYQVDELGNISLQTSPLAIQGMRVQVPTGSILVKAGISFRLDTLITRINSAVSIINSRTLLGGIGGLTPSSGRKHLVRTPDGVGRIITGSLRVLQRR